MSSAPVFSLIKARALIPLHGSSGTWLLRPRRDRRIPRVGLGNPPRRRCARDGGTKRLPMEGSQTSLRPSTDFNRPIMHIRTDTRADSADRGMEFSRVVLRGRLGDHARAHRRSGAGASTVPRGRTADHAGAHSDPRQSPDTARRIPRTRRGKSHGSRCGLSRPIRGIPILPQARSLDRSGASPDRVRRTRIADPARSTDLPCG